MGKKLWLFLACMLMTASMAFAQKQITGTVVDAENGDPLIGVAVRVPGTNNGVLSNADGKFSINLPAGKKNLSFSFMGMKAVELAAHDGMVVRLETDTKAMDELVITGYGDAKKLGSIVGAVTTLNSAKLEKATTPNFTDALAGQVSGLSVLSSSGDPSYSASIRLRGVNSIESSNTPLFILDGAPVSSSVFNTLNPSDIQSITVLKDAASTAIYGSRAANGVIVITSRKGKLNEKANFTVRAQGGWSQPVADGLEMMNSQQYMQFREMIGQPLSGDIKDLINNYGINTTWRDEVLNNAAPTYTLDAAMSGGSQNISYYISLNHHSQDGLIDQSKMHRETLRANIDARLNRWFKVGVQTNLGSNTYRQNNEAEADDLYTSNPMLFCRLAMPYESPYYYSFDGNGNIVWGDRAQRLKHSQLMLPWFVNDNRSYERNRLTLNLNAYQQINPIEGLTIRTQQALQGYDYTTDNKYYPYEAFTTPMGTPVSESTGFTSANFSRYGSYTFTHTAEYRHNWGDHGFNALIGEETIYSRSRGFGVYTEGQTDPRLVQLNHGTNVAIRNISDSRAEESFNSLFTTLSYNYAEKYYFDASYRADASSKFAPGYRWGHFYSVGGMWDAKKENFLKDVEWLDVLRLRASYGLTGNSSGAGSYDYFGKFGGDGSLYKGEGSMYISSPSNNTLTWEKVGILNVGVTFGFLDRFTFSLDAYRKRTSDMLMTIPWSFTTGFSGGMGNVGTMVNKGFDADINIDLIKTKDINWTFKANMNYNKNEITELFAGRDEYVYGSTMLKLQVGKPWGEFFAVRYAGVDSRDGKPMWYDVNGNLTKTFNEERDAVFTGKQQYAPISGGFGTTFTWKGLSITADFAWQAKKYMISNDNYFCKNANFGTSYNQAVDMLNVWTKPGDVTNIPAYGEAVEFDDHLLENASFLRMKSLILQYTLPKKWMSATKVLQNAKIFFTGRNLFTITKFSGYDPEPDINLVKFNYPNTRQFVLGAELTF